MTLMNVSLNYQRDTIVRYNNKNIVIVQIWHHFHENMKYVKYKIYTESQTGIKSHCLEQFINCTEHNRSLTGTQLCSVYNSYINYTVLCSTYYAVDAITF